MNTIPSHSVIANVRFAALLACSQALMLFSAHAQTTWDGGGADGLFSNATNWAANTLPPATGGQLVFDGSANLNATNDTFVTTLATTTGNTAFTFASGAGAFNISGTIITNGTTGGNTVLVDQNSASNQVISADLRFAGNSRDRNIRFGSGSGSLTLAGNVNFGNDIIGIGITNNAGAAGTLVLTGTNTGDGKGSQIVSGGNQLRAAFWTPQDNSRLILGSDSALGNTNTGSVTTSNAVMRGILSSRILYVSTTNGDRNLSGSSIGITGGRVEYDGVNNLTIGNVINSAGNRDLWVSGAGTLTVSSGLFLSQSNTTGYSLYVNVTNSGNAVVNGLIYDTFHSTNALTNASVLRKAGNGTLALNGDSGSTFTGNVQLENGTIRLGSVNALGATNASNYLVVTNSGGTLDLNGQTVAKMITNTASTFVLGNSSTNAATLSTDLNMTANMTVSNSGNIDAQRLIGWFAPRTITKTGAGTLTTSGTNHNSLVAWVINGGTVNLANTAGRGADRGVTINNGGTLRLSGANSDIINNSEAFTINTGGIFDPNGKQEAVASIGGTGGTVRNGSSNSATLFVGGGPGGTNSASWAGVIENGTGTMNFSKEGSGTQTLTGASTYTGSTTVTNTGTLALARAGGEALSGTTNVIVTSGAKLLISQNEQINNSAVVSLSGGTIARGAGVSETFGNLNLTADSILDYGTGAIGALTFGTYSPVSKLTVNNFLEGNVLRFVGSDLTSTIANTSLFAFDNGFTYDWNTGTSTFTITAVPEPSSVLAAVGLLALSLWPARKRLFARVR